MNLFIVFIAGALAGWTVRSSFWAVAVAIVIAIAKEGFYVADHVWRLTGYHKPFFFSWWHSGLYVLLNAGTALLGVIVARAILRGR